MIIQINFYRDRGMWDNIDGLEFNDKITKEAHTNNVLKEGK